MTPEAWKGQQTRVAGSWWEHWVPRLADGCGPLVDPPAAHPSYPRLGDAPGTYVLGR